jgi:hypothetical protein
MRFLVDVQLPAEPFNTLVRNGTAGPKLQAILGAIKPEAAYFTARNGQRGGTLVVNLDDVSHLPAIAEPFFLTFQASVTFHPTMTPEDLAKSGLDELGKQWG